MSKTLSAVGGIFDDAKGGSDRRHRDGRGKVKIRPGTVICLAISGYLIFEGVRSWSETANHQGPGYIARGEMDPEMTAEPEYKRYRYSQAGFVTFLGLFFLGCVAYGEMEIRKERRAKQAQDEWRASRATTSEPSSAPHGL